MNKSEFNDAIHLQLYVYVPLTACSCVYSHFMDQIFQILLPYRKYVTFEMKDASSDEAEKLKINCNSIVVENPPKQTNPLIFTSFFELKEFLRETYPFIRPSP